MHSAVPTALPRTPTSCGLVLSCACTGLRKLKMLVSALAEIFEVCRNTVSLTSPPLNLAETGQHIQHYYSRIGKEGKQR